MAFRLRYGRRFRNQLDSLPGDLRSVARKQLLALPGEPVPKAAKELDGYSGHYRIRLPRDYRLIYQVIEEDESLYILYVGPKLPDLYASLGLGRLTGDGE